jgi:hypothetical protein
VQPLCTLLGAGITHVSRHAEFWEEREATIAPDKLKELTAPVAEHFHHIDRRAADERVLTSWRAKAFTIQKRRLRLNNDRRRRLPIKTAALNKR